VLVKSRAIRLLAKVSDFDALKNDQVAQETLINGIINLHAQQTQIAL